MRKVSTLKPYPDNARVHTPAQVDQIAASIQEWGWTVPVLVDEEGNIIAGHGRVEAAKKLEIERVPVIVARGWTVEQKRAYVLADNKLALNSSWDDATLQSELANLSENFLQILSFDDFDTERPEPVKAIKFKFGKKSVPLSAEQAAMLDMALEKHVDENGVRHGFINSLLEGR